MFRHLSQRDLPRHGGSRRHMLPKPLLDLGFDCVIRWEAPALEMFFQFAKNVKIREGQVRAVWWVGRMFHCQVSSKTVVV
jgi:hypothetical protein